MQHSVPRRLPSVLDRGPAWHVAAEEPLPRLSCSHLRKQLPRRPTRSAAAAITSPSPCHHAAVPKGDQNSVSHIHLTPSQSADRGRCVDATLSPADRVPGPAAALVGGEGGSITRLCTVRAPAGRPLCLEARWNGGVCGAD